MSQQPWFGRLFRCTDSEGLVVHVCSGLGDGVPGGRDPRSLLKASGCAFLIAQREICMSETAFFHFKIWTLLRACLLPCASLERLVGFELCRGACYDVSPWRRRKPRKRCSSSGTGCRPGHKSDLPFAPSYRVLLQVQEPPYQG